LKKADNTPAIPAHSPLQSQTGFALAEQGAEIQHLFAK
jgi:hypothetical protein